MLSNFEDFLFWKINHYFIVENEYRLYKISSDQREIWLEKRENKDFQLIRILRYDLDWGNWLGRDITRVLAFGEGMRRSITRKPLNILNIYVSQYPPVDSYEHYLEKPVTHPDRGKTRVTSILIDRASVDEKISLLEKRFSTPLPMVTNFFAESFVDEGDELKHKTLKWAIDQKKAEEGIFKRGKPIFTYIFIAIQLIVFLIMEIFGSTTDSETLIKFGAKFNPLILEGEWWRFITPIFIHIGFLHLMMNTLALFYISGIVERIFGSIRFFIIYILAGISGTVASFIFNTHISAGASGAIFGCFGALLYFGYRHPNLFFRTMGVNVFFILGLNLAFGFTVSGVDNAGHIGGLIGGFLAAGMVALPKNKKLVQQLVFSLLIIAGLGGMLQYGFQKPHAMVDEPTTLLLAQQYIDEGKIKEANELLKNTSLDFSQSASYHFILSYTEIMLENYVEAKDYLLKAVELKPYFHEAHYNLALVYIQLGNYTDASYHAEEAVKISPNNDEYKDLVEKLKPFS